MAFLDSLGRVLSRLTPGLRLARHVAVTSPVPVTGPEAGRPFLALDVPEVGAVQILVGREWFWMHKPRRMIARLDDPQAAKVIAGMLREAQQRAMTRTPAGATTEVGATWRR